MFKLEDRTILPNVAWTDDDGRQHAANWAQLYSADEKAALGLVEVIPQPRPDDRYNFVIDNGDGTYTVTPKPPEMIKAMLKVYADDVRKRIEKGGILVNGAEIATDETSQGKIGNAVKLSEEEPAELIEFKASSGWVTLDATAMKFIGVAVGRHVRNCFKTQRATDELIDDGTITTFEGVDQKMAEIPVSFSLTP